MHQSIDSYFHIAPRISKLNPKKNWILLTTLGITIMFDFLIKVKIFKILLNVLTIGISCITFLIIYSRNNNNSSKKNLEN